MRLLDDSCTPPVKEPLLRSGPPLPLPLPLLPLPPPLLSAALLPPPPPPLLSGDRPVEMRLRRLGEADVASRSLGDDSFLTACG